MSVAFNKFQITVQYFGDANINLNSDSIKILLFNSAPSALDTVIDTTTTPCTLKSTSNITEIAAGNGYTKGGAVVPSSAYSEAAGVGSLTGNAVVFTATGAVGPFRYAVIYDNTAGSTSIRPVLGWWDAGSSVTLANTETFTINSAANGNWDATNPILTLA